MKYLLGTVASVVTVLGGLASCVQIEDNGSTSGTEVAYLSFSPVTLDYSVEGILPTKAKVPSEDMPGSEDFTIRISGQGIEDIVITPGNLTSDPIAVDAGSYTVEAYCGANGFAGPYFRKEVTVELAMGETRNIQLTDISLANAMVALVLPEGISQHLDVNSLQLTDGVTTIDVEPGQYVYAPSDRAVTAKFAGNNSLGEAKQISCSLGVLEPKHSYTVTCNLDLPNVSITLPDQQAGAWATRLYVTPAAVVSEISTDKLVYEAIPASSSDWSSAKKSEVIEGAYHVIKGLTNGTSYKVRARLGGFCSEEKQVTVKAQFDGASISASHTYTDSDSGSVLTGSKATANIGFPSSGILRTLYDAGLLTINGCSLKYGDAQVRTLSGLSGEMTVVSGWPYLPKGTGYTTELRHRCKGDTEDVKSPIASINVPAPTFTVGVSAETSYSRYQNYKNGVSGYTLELANTSGTGDRVMNIIGNVTISNDILGKNNYSSLISASLKYDGLNMLTSPTVTTNVFTPNTLENNTGLLSGSDVISQGWGQHTVAASFTFDGVGASNGTQICERYVSGIPYDLLGSTHKENWTLSGGTAEWIDGGNRIVLNHSKDNSATVSFTLNSKVNITIVTSFSIYTPTRLGSPSLSIIAGGISLEKITGKSGTAVTTSYNKTYSNATLSTNNTTIKFHREYFAGREGDVRINTLTVKYRD